MPEVRNLIAKDMKYDMIVVYVDFTCSETGHYLSQRFDAPLVLLSLFQVQTFPALEKRKHFIVFYYRILGHTLTTLWANLTIRPTCRHQCCLMWLEVIDN